MNDDSSEESDHEPTQESVKQAKVGSKQTNMMLLYMTAVHVRTENCFCFVCVELCVFLLARNNYNVENKSENSEKW